MFGEFTIMCYDIWMQLADVLKNYKFQEKPEKNFRSERSEVFAELYKYYENDWKVQTWKNYITYLKQNKKKDTNEQRELFKKSDLYFKKISVKSFCSFWLSFLTTDELYFILSIAKDKLNRKESFNKWLFYSLKGK